MLKFARSSLMRRPPPPAVTGSGELRLGPHCTPVAFSYTAQTSRGSVCGPPELMAEAFSRGDGVLTLEDGTRLSLCFLAYSAGGDTAFFETPKPTASPAGWLGAQPPASPKRAPPSH